MPDQYYIQRKVYKYGDLESDERILIDNDAIELFKQKLIEENPSGVFEYGDDGWEFEIDPEANKWCHYYYLKKAPKAITKEELQTNTPYGIFQFRHR